MATTTTQVIRASDREFRRWFGVTIVLSVIIGVIAYATAPESISLALLVLVSLCIASVASPAFGVHAIIFFSLVGDGTTMSWYPFVKNLSSRESIFFVADSLSITPLEVVLGLTWFIAVLRLVFDPATRLRRGHLNMTMTVLLVLVAIGFVRGIGSGGDFAVATVEVRPLLYLPALYLLMSVVFTRRKQYRFAFGVALVAISIQSIGSLVYYRALPAVERELLESLTDHPASVQINVLMVCLAGLVLFGAPRWQRGALIVLLIPATASYLLSQRRAAMVALFVGLIVLLIALYYRRRRRFWLIAPTAVVLGLVFLAATWNNAGPLGLPATAVKSAFFTDQLSSTDRNSSMYRDLEAFNLWVTIRSSPLLGYGFGQPFIVAVPMPDISRFFDQWQYFPHNSVLWVWIKTGYFGFCTMLYLFARALQYGARSIMRAATSTDLTIVVTATAYIMMFIVFAYVDIGWDIRPAVLLALCLAIAVDFLDLPDDRKVAR
ncbi:MAG: O-antigen ligase family protein [Desertimonas sp.]